MRQYLSLPTPTTSICRRLQPGFKPNWNWRVRSSSQISRDTRILKLATTGREDQARRLLRSEEHETAVVSIIRRKLRAEFLLSDDELSNIELLRENQVFCDLEMHIVEQVYSRLGTILADGENPYDPQVGSLDAWLLRRVHLLAQKWLFQRRRSSGTITGQSANNIDAVDRSLSDAEEMESAQNVIATISSLKDSWRACLALKLLPLHRPDSATINIIIVVAGQNGQDQSTTQQKLNQLSVQYGGDKNRSERHSSLEERLSGTSTYLNKADSECTYWTDRLAAEGIPEVAMESMKSFAEKGTLSGIDQKYPPSIRYRMGAGGRQVITAEFMKYQYEWWHCKRQELAEALRNARKEYKSLSGYQMSEQSGSGIEFEKTVAVPLPDEEIAQCLNTSKGAVTSALNKARNRLRTELDC